MRASTHIISGALAFVRPRRLELYLVRQTVIGIAVMTPVVLGMYLVIMIPTVSIQSQPGLDYLAEFVWKLLLRIPPVLDFNFPFIAMLGTMLGLGRLAGHGEINAIRFAGVSVYRISAVVLVLALALATALFAFKEYVVTEANMTERLQGKKNRVFSHNSAYHWLRSSESLVGFALTEQQIGLYRDLMVLRFDTDGGLNEVMRAAEARFFPDNPPQKQWRLTQVRLDDFTLNTSTHHPVLWRPRIFSLGGGNWLGHQAGELRWKNLNSFDCDRNLPAAVTLKSYCLEFWHRNANPVLLVALMLFAASFIYGLGRLYPMSARMVSGLIISAAFISVGNSMPYLSDAFGLPYSVLVMSPALFLLLAVCVRLAVIARR